MKEKTSCKHDFLEWGTEEKMTTRQCQKCFQVESYNGEEWIKHPKEFKSMLISKPKDSLKEHLSNDSETEFMNDDDFEDENDSD